MNSTPYAKLQNKRNQEIQQKIEQKIIEPIIKAQSTYISWIFNFMRHDVGNCIQNMDSILNANSLEELTSEHLDSLRENVKILRSTIENFSNLAPSVISETYKLRDALNSIVLLNKSKIDKQKIKLDINCDCDSIDLNYSFHSLIQIINNIIINACKNIEHVEKPLILVKSVNQSHKIQLRIYDNGTEILDTQKIFKYGYSTTGGSGLGLAHVKLICDMLKGSVYVKESDVEGYTKYFCVEIPV